jgi:hypothetical protein
MRLQVSEAAVLRREASNRRRLAAGIEDSQARETLERIADGLEAEAAQIEVGLAEAAAERARQQQAAAAAQTED